jgi:hypothetical protein
VRDVTALVIVIALLVAAGVAATLAVAHRLHVEVRALLAAFTGFERSVTPLVVTVQDERSRLAARLATETGDEISRR